MNELYEGSRVRCVRSAGGPIIGDSGTVICFLSDKSMIGVRWDTSQDCLHSLCGRCDEKHGWWMIKGDMEIIRPDIKDEVITVEVDDILTLIGV